MAAARGLCDRPDLNICQNKEQSMLKRILSTLTGKPSAPNTPAAPVTPAAPAPAEQEEAVVVYDAYGRELRITRSEWREKMLQPNLERNRDDPDALYSMIVTALNDGLAADVLPAARRLVAIDPIAERGHTLHGIVLMKNGELDAAEATLREGLEKVGESGVLLTNLAKVYAERGDTAQTDALLWRALQADPNQENGLLWWATLQRERGGEAAYLQALRTAAGLPGSWRAQLWLARHHLEQGEVAAARALYAGVLAGGGYDGSALMMISGDLGNHGQAPLMLELVGPVFDAQQHDPGAGLNLLRACQMLGRADEGEALLDRLYALGMAPLRQHLDAFARAFQKMHAQSAPGRPVEEARLEVTTLTITRPIWQYGLHNPEWLFARKPETAPQVGFFAFSRITQEASRAQSEREDDSGRYTRAIPLYLAEAAHYWSGYAASALMPVVEGGGPVVTGAATDGRALFDIVPAAMKYFVTGELACAGEGEATRWKITLHLWDCATRSCIADDGAEGATVELGARVLELEARLLDRLGLQQSKPLDPFYLHPTAQMLQPYLVELGQAFMLTLAANGHIPGAALWGERAMLDWPLNMALHWPTVEVPRLMYLSGLGKAQGYGSSVLPEYRERSLQLLREALQADSPSARLAPLVWAVFGMKAEFEAHRQSLPADTRAAYRAWLERVTEMFTAAQG